MNKQTIQLLSNNDRFSYIIITETETEIIKEYYSRSIIRDNKTEIIIKMVLPLEVEK
jgi:hypothetical protein